MKKLFKVLMAAGMAIMMACSSGPHKPTKMSDEGWKYTQEVLEIAHGYVDGKAEAEDTERLFRVYKSRFDDLYDKNGLFWDGQMASECALLSYSAGNGRVYEIEKRLNELETQLSRAN